MRCRRTGNEASTHTCCVCVCVERVLWHVFQLFRLGKCYGNLKLFNPESSSPPSVSPSSHPFWKEKFADWSASGAKIQNSNSNESKSFKTRNKRQEEVDNWKVLAAAIDKFTTGHWWWAQLFFFTNDCARKKRVEHKRLRFDICCFHSLLPSPFVVPPPHPKRKTHDDNFLHFSSVNCCLFWESSVFRRIVRFNFPPFSRFSENEKSVSPLNANWCFFKDFPPFSMFPFSAV